MGREGRGREERGREERGREDLTGILNILH